LNKKACKKNFEESGECSYGKKNVFSCSHKGRKTKNKRKCKELKEKDECEEEKNERGITICKVKKVKKIWYCFARP